MIQMICWSLRFSAGVEDFTGRACRVRRLVHCTDAGARLRVSMQTAPHVLLDLRSE